MKVAVVGGGVVGLCLAHRLSSLGAQVVVLDRAGCGEGASLGNAGWITPVLSAPLAAPGVVGYVMRRMLRPDSPMSLRLQARPEFWRWCLTFARHSRTAQWHAGLRAMLSLSERTPELFDRLRVEGVRFEMHTDGMLLVAHPQRALDEEGEHLTAAQSAGYRQPVHALDGHQIRELEPAVSDAVVGGFLVPAERHARPESLVRGLVGALRNHGAEIVEHTNVLSIVRTPQVWMLRTPSGAMEADRVVIAAGTESSRLLRGIGVRISLAGAKGYSLTSLQRTLTLHHSLYLLEAKVACSPFDGAVRLAGMFQLGARPQPRLTLRRAGV